MACTMGPGLEICLRVGFHAARDVVSLAGNKPFVSVHHLEAHVLTARQFSPGLEFPFLVLLVTFSPPWPTFHSSHVSFPAFLPPFFPPSFPYFSTEFGRQYHLNIS